MRVLSEVRRAATRAPGDVGALGGANTNWASFGFRAD